MVADIASLEKALVNADAAGDTTAASALAGEIKRIRAESVHENGLGRQIGLTARAGIKGALGIPAMVGDAAFSISNLVQRAFGAEDLPAPGRTTRALDALLNRVLPEPATPTERVAGNVAGAMAGTGLLAKVAQMSQPTTEFGQRVAQALYGNLPAQVASATSGSGAQSVAAEAGAPWWIQAPVAFAAGAAPAVVGKKYFSKFDETPSPSMQPPLPNKTQQTVNDFEAAGTTPSVGQATESNFYRAMENVVGRFPGGQKIITEFRTRQQKQLGESARTDVTAEDAGRAIEKGLRGEGGFMERFRETRTVLYDKLDDFIPGQKQIQTTNTQKALAELNSDIAGAPALSQLFKNARIQGIETALESDLNQAKVLGHPKTAQEAAMLAQAQSAKTLPYEAIKKLRTLVGEQIDNASIVSDVPRSKWKALYAALSEDLGVAAKQSGPDAVHAWKRANNYNRAAMERIEGVLDKVLGKDTTPEQIFLNATPKNADQITTLRATMKSLSPADRQIVSDAVVNRLGRATPGRQNDVGDMFSSETFLTNYSKLSDKARETLFPDLTQRNAVESIAKASSNIREGNKVLANPSGTAGAAAPYLIGGAVVGGPAAWAGVAALIGGANIGAKMLTSPSVVRWLAQGTRVSQPYLASHLAKLQSIYESTRDPALKGELADYMASISKE